MAKVQLNNVTLTREMCGICFEPNRVGFSVPSQTWRNVVPRKHHESIVCLHCFTKIADEKLVDWAKEIAFFPVSLANFVETERLDDADVRSPEK